MTDDMELTQPQAAVLFAAACAVVAKLDAIVIEARSPSDPLPRGILTCGDAMAMVSAVLVLAPQLFPALRDPEVVLDSLNSARLEFPARTIN